MPESPLHRVGMTGVIHVGALQPVGMIVSMRCSISGCSNEVLVKSRGWCRSHYLRWQRTGSPVGSQKRPVEDRFMEKVHRTAGCWLWTGAENGRGYGMFWDGDRKAYAHRWAYEHWVAPIPTGMQICHRCDVPSCVNPAHLFVGDQGDNMQDCVAKGRNSPPPPKPFVLSAEQRREVRERYAAGGVTRRQLEIEYGVDRGVIERATKWPD